MIDIFDIKPKIAVIFGGNSPEYSVSLQSAYAVITHIDKNKYDPVLIGITKSGEWFRFLGNTDKIANDTWCNTSDCVRAIISPCRSNRSLLEFKANTVHLVKLDGVMPVLHGRNGEDGTVQGLLELSGIPIIGCKSLSSSLCMDKEKARKLAYMAGVQIPKSFLLRKETYGSSDFKQAERLGYPLFVKPVMSGSSLGITKVMGVNELSEALNKAFCYDNKVIVEENIPGFEVGCAILGDTDLVIGELDEIELSGGFFDYNEKYTLQTSRIHVPARVNAQKTEEIKNAAKTIYHALDCTGFARVDMFLTPSGEIVFNEVNTIPGFTNHSCFPNMLYAIGMTFETVVNRIIGLALESAFISCIA